MPSKNKDKNKGQVKINANNQQPEFVHPPAQLPTISYKRVLPAIIMAIFLFSLSLIIHPISFRFEPVELHLDPPSPLENIVLMHEYCSLVISDDQHHSEGVAIDTQGNVFVGYHNGTLLKVDVNGKINTVVAQINGYPLGMDFDTHNNLIVCDSLNNNLLSFENLGSSLSSPIIIVNKIFDPQEKPINFLDDLAISPKTGIVYITDGSQNIWNSLIPNATITPSQIQSLSAREFLESKTTGRVLSYDPSTKKISVVADGLSFPNGIAIDPLNEDYLLVAESFGFKISKIPLITPTKGGETIDYIANLPGFPDGITISKNGKYLYVAIPKPRTKFIQYLLDKPYLKQLLGRLSDKVLEVISNLNKWGLVLQIEIETKKVVHSLLDEYGEFVSTLGSIRLQDNTLYLGTLTGNNVVKCDIRNLVE